MGIHKVKSYNSIKYLNTYCLDLNHKHKYDKHLIAICTKTVESSTANVRAVYIVYWPLAALLSAATNNEMSNRMNEE